MATVVTEHDFERGIEVLRQQIDGKDLVVLLQLRHCGLCAEACLFYTETGDPRYTPIYKLEPMRRLWQRENTFFGKLGKMLGLGEDLTEDDFAEWQEMTYDSCTLCGRCSMVCPVGNDIAYMIRKQREAYAASGYTPEGLQGASQRALDIGSPMGLTYKTLAAQIKHVEKATGQGGPGRQARGRLYGPAVIDGGHQLSRVHGGAGAHLRCGRCQLDTVEQGVRGDQ